ncbi:DUF1672 domain-containing protein [Halobacillus litoralis]|uniref:DUF1672 family protein n=1 Tax=Halobacillus litoralis TaxID=45668 RepID=UPI001CD604AD|nr:DUF1672 family protein [Halobacillus litoralis]MCA0970747.1 DUF1672 domain-containing protein [Halobacillus litoralis]
MKSIFILVSSLILAGCSAWTASEENEKTRDYIPVQDYTGQGYDLPNGDKTDQIAEEHAEEIETAVVRFFKEEYKTDVEVHNMVGAEGEVSVFVESKGKPHFYSFAIVPIDTRNQEVLTDEVWSQEYQVEEAIMSGLYAWIKEDEFDKLNDYIASLTTEYPITGLQKEALENVGAGYYMTRYYNVPVGGGKLEHLLKAYLTNPERTKEEWTRLLGTEPIDPNMVTITLQLYMEKPNIPPDNVIFNKIVEDIENMTGIPAGTYGIYLHDNEINQSSGQNNKPNTLEKSLPDPIIKN